MSELRENLINLVNSKADNLVFSVRSIDICMLIEKDEIKEMESKSRLTGTAKEFAT